MEITVFLVFLVVIFGVFHKDEKRLVRYLK